MDAVIQSFLAGFPVLLMHFSVTIAMLVLGVTIYTWITPHKDVALVREGNVAAAISLSLISFKGLLGSLLAFKREGIMITVLLINICAAQRRNIDKFT